MSSNFSRCKKKFFRSHVIMLEMIKNDKNLTWKNLDKFSCLEVMFLWDIEMQTWLRTWRWEWQVFSMIFFGMLLLRGFSLILIDLSIWVFLEFWNVFLFGGGFSKILLGSSIGTLFFSETSRCRHGYADMTWDLEMGMTGFFHDFDGFSELNVIYQGFW